MSTDKKVNEIRNQQIAGQACADALTPLLKEMCAATNALREDMQVMNWILFEKLGVTNEERDAAVALAIERAKIDRAS